MKKMTLTLGIALGGIAAFAPLGLTAQDKPEVAAEKKETIESLFDTYLNEQLNTEKVWVGVKDAASARKAAEKIDAISKNIQALEKRLKKFPMPDLTTRIAFTKKRELHRKEMREVAVKASIATGIPEVTPIYINASVTLDEALEGIDVTFERYFEVKDGEAIED